MTAAFFSAMIVALVGLLVRWIASAPLVRTFSRTIDIWADSVQGTDAKQIR